MKKTLRQEVNDLKNNFTDMCEGMLLQAQLKKVYYNELIKQGFTEEQAIELTKV